VRGIPASSVVNPYYRVQAVIYYLRRAEYLFR